MVGIVYSDLSAPPWWLARSKIQTSKHINIQPQSPVTSNVLQHFKLISFQHSFHIRITFWCIQLKFLEGGNHWPSSMLHCSLSPPHPPTPPLRTHAQTGGRGLLGLLSSPSPQCAVSYSVCWNQLFKVQFPAILSFQISNNLIEKGEGGWKWGQLGEGGDVSGH